MAFGLRLRYDVDFCMNIHPLLFVYTFFLVDFTRSPLLLSGLVRGYNVRSLLQLTRIPQCMHILFSCSAPSLSLCSCRLSNFSSVLARCSQLSSGFFSLLITCPFSSLSTITYPHPTDFTPESIIMIIPCMFWHCASSIMPLLSFSYSIPS